jgi:hypothetical protein
MKLIDAVRAVSCALVLAAASFLQAAAAATVDVSLNVFPTEISNPNGGGAWTLVAKTDAPLGIAGLSAYLKNINATGITIESDLGSILDNGQPYVGVFGNVVNLVFGYNLADGPITAGVGTIAFSDGPDPLGDPVWNDATLIFAGSYNSVVPMFTTSGPNQNETAANVLASVMVGDAAVSADVTTVVRVAVPEPATIGLAACAVVATAFARRRR